MRLLPPLLFLALLLTAAAAPTPTPPRQLTSLLSADSLRFVLLAVDFPNRGYDYAHPDSVPVYQDSTFSGWTAERPRAAQLLRRLPAIKRRVSEEELERRDACGCRREFRKLVFFFPRSVFELRLLNLPGFVGTPRGYFELQDSIAFGQLKPLLNRRAYHREKFDSLLTRLDSAQLRLPYNRTLRNHAGNGAERDGRQYTLWKTSWYWLR
ncbi:hypothetical protein EJV47_24150 [Hymenobacter gummosus]|uniref:Uncharacterized protein n=1 Tax=Hymenobacter gummosus TaxID=1776032 RepID=A0A431TW66_9BACT|nr:hypothetical protein [Hymenobacter gummosus]RTQ45925.1 hypothetical protein EJV47_24150 [Hymenobacter gummosus]